jgi:hypothetical protein
MGGYQNPTSMGGSPMQAQADAAQATAQGYGLGGGHGLVRQDGGGYAPMASMGGPGPNNMQGWNPVFQRMQQPQGMPPGQPMSDPRQAGGFFGQPTGTLPPGYFRPR